MKTALEILNERMESYNNRSVLQMPEMYKVRFADSEKEFIQQSMEVYADQFKSKWIPVSERLPDIKENVFVLFENEAGKSRRLIAFYVPKLTVEDDGDYEGDSIYNEENDTYYWPDGWYEYQYEADVHFMLSQTVTHWMPLPEKPEL